MPGYSRKEILLRFKKSGIQQYNYRMTQKNLLTDIADNILTITINRPDKLNALNRITLDELRKALINGLEANDVMGIIITGAGEKAFVAGADISEFTGISVDDGQILARNGHAIFKLIESGSKPIIAAVNGFALGGGCELAMACHLRIASANALFGQPEVSLGLIPGYGGTQRLVQLIGKGKALELMLTADMIKADEALKLGLVNHVTSLEELIPATRDLMKKINTKSPVAIREVITCVNAYFESGTDGFEKEISQFGNCFGTDDFKEGTAAFIEKRKPEFSGN